MSVKLLTENHLEFLSLKGGCRGSSESTLVKISNCWKSHAAAHISFQVKAQVYGIHLHIMACLTPDQPEMSRVTVIINTKLTYKW